MVNPAVIGLGAIILAFGLIGISAPMADNGFSSLVFANICESNKIAGLEFCQTTNVLLVSSYAFMGIGSVVVTTGSIARKN